MLAFHDYEIGASGTITAAAWGPDSNATVRRALPEHLPAHGLPGHGLDEPGHVLQRQLLRHAAGGLQRQLPGRADRQRRQHGRRARVRPRARLHRGPRLPAPAAPGTCRCSRPPASTPGPRSPRTSTGTPGTAADDDVVFLFDMSVPEGDTWQQFRAWFAVTFPCSGVLDRRLPAAPPLLHLRGRHREPDGQRRRRHPQPRAHALRHGVHRHEGRSASRSRSSTRSPVTPRRPWAATPSAT